MNLQTAGIIVFYVGLIGYMAVYALRPNDVHFLRANHRRAYTFLLTGVVVGAFLFWSGS